MFRHANLFDLKPTRFFVGFFLSLLVSAVRRAIILFFVLFSGLFFSNTACSTTIAQAWASCANTVSQYTHCGIQYGGTPPVLGVVLKISNSNGGMTGSWAFHESCTLPQVFDISTGQCKVPCDADEYEVGGQCYPLPDCQLPQKIVTLGNGIKSCAQDCGIAQTTPSSFCYEPGDEGLGFCGANGSPVYTSVPCKEPKDCHAINPHTHNIDPYTCEADPPTVCGEHQHNVGPYECAPDPPVQCPVNSHNITDYECAPDPPLPCGIGQHHPDGNPYACVDNPPDTGGGDTGGGDTGGGDTGGGDTGGGDTGGGDTGGGDTGGGDTGGGDTGGGDTGGGDTGGVGGGGSDSVCPEGLHLYMGNCVASDLGYQLDPPDEGRFGDEARDALQDAQSRLTDKLYEINQSLSSFASNTPSGGGGALPVLNLGVFEGRGWSVPFVLDLTPYESQFSWIAQAILFLALIIAFAIVMSRD